VSKGRRAAGLPAAGTADPDTVPVRGLAERLKDVTRNSIFTAVVEEARYDVATDEELLERHREGDSRATEALLSRYRNFARMKARSYFLAGADGDDIVQESMIGLFKAIRDFQPGKRASFRAFADLCITRQLITAIRSARCQKHHPLNSYVSLSKPVAPDEDPDRVLMDVLSGPGILDPLEVVIATEELGDIKAAFDQLLSEFETEVLRLYADGKSYHDISRLLEREVKSIDNALQRIKRKILLYLRTRDTERSAGPARDRPRAGRRVRPSDVPERTAATV